MPEESKMHAETASDAAITFSRKKKKNPEAKKTPNPLAPFPAKREAVSPARHPIEETGDADTTEEEKRLPVSDEEPETREKRGPTKKEKKKTSSPRYHFSSDEESTPPPAQEFPKKKEAKETVEKAPVEQGIEDVDVKSRIDFFNRLFAGEIEDNPRPTPQEIKKRLKELTKMEGVEPEESLLPPADHCDPRLMDNKDAGDATATTHLRIVSSSDEEPKPLTKPTAKEGAAYSEKDELGRHISEEEDTVIDFSERLKQLNTILAADQQQKYLSHKTGLLAQLPITDWQAILKGGIVSHEDKRRFNAIHWNLQQESDKFTIYNKRWSTLYTDVYNELAYIKTNGTDANKTSAEAIEETIGKLEVNNANYENALTENRTLLQEIRNLGTTPYVARSTTDTAKQAKAAPTSESKYQYDANSIAFEESSDTLTIGKSAIAGKATNTKLKAILIAFAQFLENTDDDEEINVESDDLNLLIGVADAIQANKSARDAKGNPVKLIDMVTLEYTGDVTSKNQNLVNLLGCGEGGNGKPTDFLQRLHNNKASTKDSLRSTYNAIKAYYPTGPLADKAKYRNAAHNTKAKYIAPQKSYEQAQQRISRASETLNNKPAGMKARLGA